MKPVILYIISEDWYFLSHRLQLALAAIKNGYKVVLLTNLCSCKDKISSYGIKVINYDISRGSINPIKDLKSIFAIRKIIKRVNPDIIHSVALKPVLYGGIAVRWSGRKKYVSALAGLGFIYSSSTLKARVLKYFVNIVLKWLLSQKNVYTIVQNKADKRILMEQGGVSENQLTLIRGSGVDTKRFAYSSESSGVPVIAFVSRMLWDKGIGDLVEACEILDRKGIQYKLLLVGDSDLKNPGSVSEAQLREWGEKKNISWIGRVNDIDRIWREANLCVLPTSYGEGLPKSLLEAASSGRAIVTTDTPGCSDVVIDGENGLLVPIKNVETLAQAIGKLLSNTDLRTKMGVKGRERVLKYFDEKIIIKQTLALYTKN